VTQQRVVAAVLAAVLVLSAVWWVGSTVVGDDPAGADRDAGTVALADLPAEAAATVALIDAGGPFPYEQDGGTFGNFEGLLPPADPGYYKEYTVETPGSSDRGARRIVAGAGGELYWTADHYASFERIQR
jgi:ribonuclease T1